MANKILTEHIKDMIKKLLVNSCYIIEDDRISVKEEGNTTSKDMLKVNYTITIQDEIDSRVIIKIRFSGGRCKWIDRTYNSPTTMRILMNSLETYEELYKQTFGKGEM